MKQQTVFLCLILAVCAKAASEPKINPFIINGTAATTSPSFALVTYTNAAGLGFFGGGTIISLTHILTAAHFIIDFVSWQIGVGSVNTNTLLRVLTNNAIAHPNFNTLNRANDIGIITLPNPLVLSINIQPIALPQIGENLPFEYEQGRIYGFGFQMEGGQQAANLQLSYQRVTNHTQCVAAHITAVVGQQFCTRDLTRLSNTCVGDFGGGFIVPYRGVDLLVGVSSMTVQQCNTLAPAIYTRVSNYRPWIRTVTGV